MSLFNTLPYNELLINAFDYGMIGDCKHDMIGIGIAYVIVSSHMLDMERKKYSCIK